jgi:ComEC/Rec2-related protein
VFSRAPLAAAAFLSAAGILLRTAGDLSLAVSGSVAASLLLSGWWLGSRSARPSSITGSRPYPHSLAGRLVHVAGEALLAAGFFFLGGFCSSASDLHARRHVFNLLAEAAGPIGPVDAEGEIASEPARRPAPEEGCSVDLALSSLVTRGVGSTASGTVRIHVPPAPEGVNDPCLLGTGDRVRIATTLVSPRSFGNPGALDYSLFLRSREIDAMGRAPSARLVTISETAGPIRRAITWTRRSILASIEGAFDASRDNAAAGISAALLLGARDGIPRSAERTLQAAGTSHLLAVSGFNVAVIAGAIWLVLRRSRLAPGARSVTVATVIVVYLLLTGGEPSVERAVLGSLVLIAGILFGRRVSILNVVGVAGLFLIAARPSSVHDASFQLTFATTFGLAAFVPSLARGIPGAAWIRSAVAVNLTAFASSAPLVAYLFNRVAPGAIPANLVASPLMALALLIAAILPIADLGTRALGAIGVAFTPGLAPPEALAWISARAIDTVILVSDLTARVPFLSLLCTTPPVWAPAGCLALAAVAALAADRGRARSFCL